MSNWLAPIDIGVIMGLVLAWAVLGLALAFRLLNFPDLTVEGSLPLGAAVVAVCVQRGVPLGLGMLLAMLAAAGAGALTAQVHLRFRINKFLAGIIIVAICYSLTLHLMGSSNIGMLRQVTLFDLIRPLDQAVTSDWHPVTALVLMGLLALGVSGLYLGLSSRPGARLRAAGSNPDYAGSLGIDVARHLTVGLAMTNALAGLSGALLAMYQGFADVSMGQGVLVLALAAMTIGERLLPARRLPITAFVLLAAIGGSVGYQVLVAYAVRLGLAANDLKLVTAVMVLVVVASRLAPDGQLVEEINS